MEHLFKTLAASALVLGSTACESYTPYKPSPEYVGPVCRPDRDETTNGISILQVAFMQSFEKRGSSIPFERFESCTSEEFQIAQDSFPRYFGPSENSSKVRRAKKIVAEIIKENNVE